MLSLTDHATSARTYPASGAFTDPQRELYQAVLAAQKSVIAHCRANANMSMWDLHRLSCELLRIELRQIGFGNTFDLDTLYPHYVTHSIGIGEKILGLAPWIGQGRWLTCSHLDLHESDAIDRTQKYVLYSFFFSCNF